MANTVEITNKQVLQFNIMLATLKRISKDYQTPDELRNGSESEFGLDYEEALEMAYETIQSDAEYALQGIEPINIPNP